MNSKLHLEDELSTPANSRLEALEEGMSKNYDDACRILQQTRSLLVVSGAGISKESGVPTYQDADNGSEGCVQPITFAEYQEDCCAVWRRIDQWRKVIAKCAPNTAHEELARWEKEALFDRFLIATQNVDGLHKAAGSESVTELHGNIWKLAIRRPPPLEDEAYDFSSDYFAWQDPGQKEQMLRKWSDENGGCVWTNRDVPFKHIPPSNDPDTRPHIVMTGESYGTRLIWVENFIEKGVDAVLIVGCSERVDILNRILRNVQTRNQDSRIININPGTDCIQCEHIFLNSTACKAFEKLPFVENIVFALRVCVN